MGKAFDGRYPNQFGFVAGDSPSRRPALGEAVSELARLIRANGVVRMYVHEMIHQVPPPYRTVDDVDELLAALSHSTRTAPVYHPDPNYRQFFPISTLFLAMMMTPAGAAAFRDERFNGAIRKILKERCRFLDSSESLSVLHTGEHGWLSPPAYEYSKLDEFIIPDRSAPHWGWKSFNDFFHRQIKAERRPVAAPHDPKVIVSANDGTVYNIARNVRETDDFWLKGQPYSLVNMLDDSEYLERFVGGDVFQSFLSGTDYHRFRSPIDGIVRHAQVVNGLMFSTAESAGPDLTAGTYSQGYEASVNTRGLVFIESGDPVLGMVCVMPIGMTEISSVTLGVAKGDRVKKGDELGYFSYGGSSLCLIFQRGAVAHFTVRGRPAESNPHDGPRIQVNAQIALAR